MLELTNLSKRYGSTVALDDLGLTVKPGTMVGFVGTNGAGKTTAMRIVMGVLSADSGEVRWLGRTVTADARRSFGYMPEERGLYPRMRVMEQLTYLAELRGVDAATATGTARELLGRLGLTVGITTASSRCRSVTSSACSWPQLSSTDPSCWCSTNRSAGWIRSVSTPWLPCCASGSAPASA